MLSVATITIRLIKLVHEADLCEHDLGAVDLSPAQVEVAVTAAARTIARPGGAARLGDQDAPIAATIHGRAFPRWHARGLTAAEMRLRAGGALWSLVARKNLERREVVQR